MPLLLAPAAPPLPPAGAAALALLAESERSVSAPRSPVPVLPVLTALGAVLPPILCIRPLVPAVIAGELPENGVIASADSASPL